MDSSPAPSRIELSLRSLRERTPGSGRYAAHGERAAWDGRTAAAIVCDMWDRHWCASATARVAEMAPRMNGVLAALRRRGVLIIHAPSGTMAHYAGHPGRILAMEAPPPMPPETPPEGAPEPPLPIDDSNGGCPDQPRCAQGRPWTRQIATLSIEDGDAITDSTEALRLMGSRGIRNVFLMGVHANMCVLGRPFGIRQLVRHGFQVALVRDMTDTMYDPRMPPRVDHFTGTDLVVWHIEKYWCPTVTSDQLLTDGAATPFRFQTDARGEAPGYREPAEKDVPC